MKSFLVIWSLLALTNARPDASHVPSGSYLPPIDSSLHVPSGGYLPPTGYSSSHIGIGGIGTYSPTHVLGGIVGFPSGGVVSLGHGALGFGLGAGLGFSGHGGDIGLGHGGNIEQKHVYFYAAPDDEHHSRLRINIVPNAHRNTKVIFVKAPSSGSLTPEISAPLVSEDKTLVYVLSKRPEHGGHINIPAGAGVVQTKPEVHYIKYNNQHDAEAQIADTLGGHRTGSHVPDVGTATNFVSNLHSGVHSGHGSGGHAVGGISVGSIGIHGGSSHAGFNHGVSSHGRSSIGVSSHPSFSHGGSGHVQASQGGSGHGDSSHEGASHGGASHGGSSHGGSEGGVPLGGGSHGATHGPPGLSGPY